MRYLHTFSIAVAGLSPGFPHIPCAPCSGSRRERGGFSHRMVSTERIRVGSRAGLTRDGSGFQGTVPGRGDTIHYPDVRPMMDTIDTAIVGLERRLSRTRTYSDRPHLDPLAVHLAIVPFQRRLSADGSDRPIVPIERRLSAGDPGRDPHLPIVGVEGTISAGRSPLAMPWRGVRPLTH